MSISVKDTIQFHTDLNPVAWQQDKLKSHIRQALLKVAKAFIDTWDIKVPVKDIILTGSNANYNWTKFSDFDLHIVVDLNKVQGVRPEFLRNYLLIKKTLWNKNHNIQVVGFDVEVYPQDIKDKLVATGVFSLQDNKWITHPGRLPPKTDVMFSEIQHLASRFAREIDHAIATRDLTVMTSVWDSVGSLRKNNLGKEGEFGLHNLTFKVLRNNNYIKKLADAIDKAQDDKLSVESFNQKNKMIQTFKEFISEKVAAWQRKEGKNPEGGLNARGVASYRRENPGSKLKTAVTTKPSKLKKGSKSWKRRKSFCARMSGMKRRLTSKETASDPNSRINKSLRKWNC